MRVVKKNKLLLALLVILLAGILAGALIWKEPQKGVLKPAGISEEEKAQIEAWILENNFNKYGDPEGTMYTGGTPLFDERTGQGTDQYEYILKKHPDRPWLK